MIFTHAFILFFFFQAEDGIRDLVRSRGLGDVYKRQTLALLQTDWSGPARAVRTSVVSSWKLILYVIPFAVHTGLTAPVVIAGYPLMVNDNVSPGDAPSSMEVVPGSSR